MNKTVKLSLIILIFAAGFVVFRILFIFSNQFDAAGAKVAPIEVEYNESNDYDHDGLSNSDEAFWNTDPFKADTDGDGFFDGEEVLSERDPSDSSGNDSLAEKSKLITTNLTTGVSNLIVAGIAAGDLKKSADAKTFNDAVDRISLAAIYDALDVLESITLQEENFNVTEPTAEAQQNYINVVARIIQDDLEKIVFNQPQEINRFFVNAPDIFDNPNQTKIKNTFLAHALKFQQAYQVLYEFPVPKNWIDIHKDGLLILKKLEMHYRSVALSNDDPLKMMVVLANLQTIFIEVQPLLNKIARQIKSNNLASPDNEIFKVINGLNNF